MSQDTVELLRRLMRAHLSLAQAQEYIRLRLRKRMRQDGWTSDEVFKLIDKDSKGWIGVFDIERLLINHKRSGTSRSLVSDIELIIQMYDRSGQSRRILVDDFMHKLGSTTHH